MVRCLHYQAPHESPTTSQFMSYLHSVCHTALPSSQNLQALTVLRNGPNGAHLVAWSIHAGAIAVFLYPRPVECVQRYPRFLCSPTRTMDYVAGKGTSARAEACSAVCDR